MARIRFLVAYDIADDARLRKVHACVTSYGHFLQYSLYVCDLEPMELIALRTELREIIHHRSDRIAFVNLGDAATAGERCFEFMGSHPVLPSSGGPTII